MIDATDFAIWARRAIDLIFIVNGLFMVLQSALYSAGVKHSDGSPLKAAIVVVNAIGMAAWLIWRPVF